MSFRKHEYGLGGSAVAPRPSGEDELRQRLSRLTMRLRDLNGVTSIKRQMCPLHNL
jgi:hypothetical protein